MGYYVNYEFENVKIKEENASECLKAINALFLNNKRYGWVDAPSDEHGYKSLMDAIESWSFGLSYYENAFFLDNFSGEKLGDENTLFETIAPFVEENAFIYGRGEDGCMWRIAFKDGHAIEQSAKVTYE